MRGLIILANGFEDSEAITTIDILKRSKIIVDMVSVNETLEVESQYNLYIKADILLKDIKYDYDFLIIPGGKAVFSVLDKNEDVSRIIRLFVESNKLVAAICAGPSQVGKHGYYQNCAYTCFPNCNSNITNGNYQPDKAVVRDKNMITAKSMAYTIDFALEIIEYLQGTEQRNIIYKNIHGKL